MRPWDLRTPGNWWRIKQYRDKTSRTKADRLVYPHVLRYRNHGEFGCYGLIPNTTFEDLKRGFDEARAAGGDFCLATHYWEVDAALKRVLVRVPRLRRRFPRRAIRRRRAVVPVELMMATGESKGPWARKAEALYDDAYARKYRDRDEALLEERTLSELRSPGCSRCAADSTIGSTCSIWAAAPAAISGA